MNSIKSWHIEHILALTYSKNYGLDPRFSLLMFYYSLCPIYGATKMPNSYHCNWTVKRRFSLVLFFIYSFGEELLNIISLHTRANSINKLHAHVKWEKLTLVFEYTSFLLQNRLCAFSYYVATKCYHAFMHTIDTW